MESIITCTFGNSCEKCGISVSLTPEAFPTFLPATERSNCKQCLMYPCLCHWHLEFPMEMPCSMHFGLDGRAMTNAIDETSQTSSKLQIDIPARSSAAIGLQHCTASHRSRRRQTFQSVHQMGTPLELVSYNAKTGKFEVGQAAMKALRGVRGPVGVVAVCGRARQGKSFILNQLLSETSGGFVVGPTHRPCTKGLWMWSSPQKRTGKDGTDHHLVRMPAWQGDVAAWGQSKSWPAVSPDLDQNPMISGLLFCLAPPPCCKDLYLVCTPQHLTPGLTLSERRCFWILRALTPMIR